MVVGAGNAALCAALSAQEGGARVLVLEKAPLEERGGNSLFTAGGFRFVHDGVEDLRKDVLTDLSEAEVDQIVMPKLSKEQYMEDLMRVTEDESDEQLAEMLIGRSRETIVWMRSYGVRFIPMFGRQSYKVEGKHHFYGGVNIEAVGGGFGLVEALIKRAEKLGIEIRYGTELRELRQDQKGNVTGARVKGPKATRRSPPRRWCWPAAASRPIRRCAPAISARAGSCAACAARGITPAAASARRSISARSPSAAGRPAMPCSGTSARRRSAIAWCWTTSRSTLIPSVSWST